MQLPSSNTDREKIQTHVFATAGEAGLHVAKEISDLVRGKARAGRPCALGLATGSTAMAVYKELVRMHREEGLSFANVAAFSLDEYYPMAPDAYQSHARFMREHLFDHVDVSPENIHMPDGTLPPDKVSEYCRQYEQAIADAGGIDLQLLVIGQTEHIGFNEPGSGRESRTRLITLDRTTRLEAAGDFFGEERVPRQGITMGVGTILAARRIVLLSFGESNAAVMARAVEGEVTGSVPASYLQTHPNVQVALDEASAADLTRFKCPWTIEPCRWDDGLIRKAVIWLALKTGKSILKLTSEDYNENSLQDMQTSHGPAYEVNLRVFRSLQATITGWPGGKPESARQPGDARRAADEIFPKRIVIFSPHPDDDVISMAGTLIRLVEQGHEVYVAYQTSGGLAVFDHDVIRFADFAIGFNRAFDIDRKYTTEVEQHIEQFLRQKGPGQIDSPEVRQVKALIRRGESRAAARYTRVPLENLHFLDMPFYDTGRVVKNPLSDRDIEIISDLLAKIKPHQIYAAGDLSDPHGTHRTCLEAISQALRRVWKQSWAPRCQIWLYRGAWQEWEPDQVQMAVPLSPQELLKKRDAIFRHQSQKDRALFPGVDEREFWERAEARNRRTANIYDQLGLAEYEAIEAFRGWTPGE